MTKIVPRVLIALFLLAFAKMTYAQQQSATINDTAGSATTESEKEKKAKEAGEVKKASEVKKDGTASAGPEATEPTPAPQSSRECKLCRWIDLQTATISTRYRWVRS